MTKGWGAACCEGTWTGIGAAPAGEEEGLPGAADGAVLVAAGVQVGGGLEGRLLPVQQVREHAPA